MAKSTVRVGLDLEQTTIAATQIKGTKHSQILTCVAVRSLPEGLVFEGEVVDVDGLAKELKSFWKQGGFSGRNFRLGVANQKIVVRTMEFPDIDEKELRAAVEFQAQEAIPIPVAEAILDYQVLSRSTAEDGSVRQKILLVAAQRDMIQQFVDVATKAGLRIDGIDLQAFALARALSDTRSFIDNVADHARAREDLAAAVSETSGLVDEALPATAAESVALVNIGAGITNLVVAVNGLPQFTRVVNLGCESLVQALATNRGIERDEAEQLRIAVGLTGETPTPVEGMEPETVTEINTVLDASCEVFADEIRRSIDYYHTQEHEGQIAKLLLTGAGSMTRNLCGFLSQALHLPVELGNPLKDVGENKSKLSQTELEAMAPRLAIAIGLALEGEE